MELEWFCTKMGWMKRKSILAQELDLILETDASMQGWETVCKGIQTEGPWSQTGQEHHINYLELLAASCVCSQGIYQESGECTHPSTYRQQDCCFYVNGGRSPIISRLAIQFWH